MEFKGRKFATLLSKGIGMLGCSLDWSLRTDLFSGQWSLGTGSYHDYLLLSLYDWSHNTLSEPVSAMQTLVDLNCHILDWGYFQGKALVMAMHVDSTTQGLKVVEFDGSLAKQILEIPLEVPGFELELLFPQSLMCLSSTVCICYENEVVVQLNPLDDAVNSRTFGLEGLVSSHFVEGDCLLVATDSGQLYSIGEGRCKVLGSLPADSLIAVCNGLLVGMSYMGQGAVLDRATANQLSTFSNTGPILDAVAIRDFNIEIDSLYLACGSLDQSSLKKAVNSRR